MILKKDLLNDTDKRFLIKLKKIVWLMKNLILKEIGDPKVVRRVKKRCVHVK